MLGCRAVALPSTEQIVHANTDVLNRQAISLKTYKLSNVQWILLYTASSIDSGVLSMCL